MEKEKKKSTVINGDSINLSRYFICLSFIANAKKLCKVMQRIRIEKEGRTRIAQLSRVAQ